MQTPTGPVPSFKVDWKPTIAKRREIILDKPPNRLNLWSIIKNCIGKDLSKIPLPVNHNDTPPMLIPRSSFISNTHLCQWHPSILCH